MILVDLTVCPECGHPAEVEWRTVLESTDGPIEPARISCVRGHWFLLPVAWLEWNDPNGRVPVGTAADEM